MGTKKKIIGKAKKDESEKATHFLLHYFSFVWVTHATSLPCMLHSFERGIYNVAIIAMILKKKRIKNWFCPVLVSGVLIKRISLKLSNTWIYFLKFVHLQDL